MMQDPSSPERFIAAVFDANEHADYESLERFVDGTLGPSDAKRLEQHADICQSCAAEIDDLRSFAAGFSRKNTHPSFPWFAFAAAVALIAFAALLFVGHRTGSVLEVRTSRVSVRDANGVIALDRAGHVSGVSAPWQPLVAQVLSTGHFGSIPSTLTGPAVRRDVLRGDTATATVRILHPAEEVIAEDAPAFEWAANDRHALFIVEVFDSEFRTIIQSPKMKATRWVPPLALPRGQELRWQVTQIARDHRITAPAPPEPPARFFIVDSEAAKQIDSARAANSHLILAAVYARSGMRDAAVAELDQLARANPRSSLIGQLLRSVKK